MIVVERGPLVVALAAVLRDERAQGRGVRELRGVEPRHALGDRRRARELGGGGERRARGDPLGVLDVHVNREVEVDAARRVGEQLVGQRRGALVMLARAREVPGIERGAREPVARPRDPLARGARAAHAEQPFAVGDRERELGARLAGAPGALEVQAELVARGEVRRDRGVAHVLPHEVPSIRAASRMSSIAAATRPCSTCASARIWSVVASFVASPRDR